MCCCFEKDLGKLFIFSCILSVVVLNTKRLYSINAFILKSSMIQITKVRRLKDLVRKHGNVTQSS